MRRVIRYPEVEAIGARRVLAMAKAYPDVFDTEAMKVLERLARIVEQDVEDYHAASR